MNILVLFQQKVVKPVQTTSKKLANNYLVAYERNLPINIWCLYTAGMWESRNQTVWGPAQKNMSALVHKNLWLLWCWDTLLEILVYTFLGRLSHGNGARARSASCHPQKQLHHPRFLSSVLQMRLWRSEEGPPTSLSQSPSAGANKNVCMYINICFLHIYIYIYLSIDRSIYLSSSSSVRLEDLSNEVKPAADIPVGVLHRRVNLEHRTAARKRDGSR